MAEQVMPKTITANGAEFSYVEKGTGGPVIFVHGSLGDYRVWMRQVMTFSEKYQAISYSRRYHYPNPWTGTGTDYTVSLHADDLIALIEALDVGPVNVVGNSFGAYTTLVAATRRPDLLRKLVIGEPPILPWLKTQSAGKPYYDAFMRTTWEPVTRAFQKGDLEQGVRLFINGVSGQHGVFDHLPAQARQLMLDNALSLSAETASPGYFTEITPQQVEQIPVPMLFLRGQNSSKMFHLVVDQLIQAAPNAQNATIPDASHSMPSNNPPVYNQVVIEFLG